MVEIERDAQFARSSEFIRRRLLRIGIASALAGSMLVGASAADARITHILILTRTTAFGGYSFPGVGQYEVITGIATGEIDPNDPKNAVITDIALAPRLANGNVMYQHNFYILKPLDLSKGNHKMMYEPPNRGGKTYQTLNHTPDGTNDPAALTDAPFRRACELIPLVARLHDGVERLGKQPRSAQRPDGDGELAGRAQSRWLDDHRTRVRVHRQSGRDLYAGLSRGVRKPGSGQAVLTHRIHLDDTPQVVPASGWAYTDATNTAIKLTTGSFVANDIYEFSYIAKNPTVERAGIRGDSRLQLVPALCDERRFRHAQSARRRRHQDLHRNVVATGAHAQRLHASRVQPGRKRQARSSTA